jgi:phospholipase C
VLKTVEQRWNIPPLTARDAAAPGLGDVVTLTVPRTDDVLAGVTVPVSGSAGPSAGQVSHLQAVHDELYARYDQAAVERVAAPPGPAAVTQDPDQRPG